MSSRPFTRACKRRASSNSGNSNNSVIVRSVRKPRASVGRRVGSSTVKWNIAMIDITPMAPALLPLLDDVTTGLVASFLPARDLGNSALISKTWLEFNSDDSLWQPFLSSIDPLSTLGDGTIVKELTSFFSCKQVVSEMSTRLCSLCKRPTNGFFVLTGTRLCFPCFRTDERVQMCSYSYAKAQYLISAPQEAKLPSFDVEGAEGESAMSVTTCSAAKASAVARFGSETALKDELAKRKAEPGASCESPPPALLPHDIAARKNRKVTASGSSSSSLPRATPGGSAPRRSPPITRSRVQALDQKVNKVNQVGMKQLKLGHIEGERYGFFTVVNETFFDSGPTIVISDSAATAKDASSRGQAPATRSGKNRSNTQQTTNSVLHVFGRSPHQRGRKLIKAISTAKAGTTIKIEASVAVDASLEICTSVKLIGDKEGDTIEMLNGPIEVVAPSILRNLSVASLPDEREEFEPEGFPDNLVGPAVIVQNDTLIEDCRFGRCPAGQAVMLQLGRMVVKGSTFSDVVYGVVVVPWENAAHLTTTVHLEGNHFDRCDVWGVMKGPARCHPQSNEAVVEANEFFGFGYMHEAISDQEYLW